MLVLKLYFSCIMTFLMEIKGLNYLNTEAESMAPQKLAKRKKNCEIGHSRMFFPHSFLVNIVKQAPLLVRPIRAEEKA